MSLGASTETGINQRGLFLARLVWIAILLFGMVVYAVFIPEHLQALSAGPEDFDPFLQYFTLTQREAQVLIQARQPASFYPDYIFAFEILWVLFGFILFVMGMFIYLLPILVLPALLSGPNRVWYLVFSTPITVLSFTMIPLSITFSILRYRLWDVDLIIRRTLVYGSLTAGLALIYFLGVVIF